MLFIQNMKIINYVKYVLLIFLINNCWANSLTKSLLLHQKDTSLNAYIINLGIRAYNNAKNIKDKNILTIIDYSLPSNQKRLWVIDMKNNNILFNTFVAHGENTGEEYAQYFSNEENSHKSSLGLFKTGLAYHGKYGISLKLFGLEKEFNSNAFQRGIVLHGGKYVSQSYVDSTGTIGRSHGCPVVSNDDVINIINTIKNTSLVFVFSPDEQWINTSKYLKIK